MKYFAKIDSGVVSNIIVVKDSDLLSNWPGYVSADESAKIGGGHDGTNFSDPPKSQAQLDNETKVAEQNVKAAADKVISDRLKAVDLKAIDPVLADVVRRILK